MDRRFKRNMNQPSLDFIFILALLFLFAFSALMAIIFGSNAYREIKDGMDSNFEYRTPLSYISTKLRQNDDVNSIRIIEKEGTEALVLEKLDNGEICQTWIYEYQSSLYEVYIEKGAPFHLEDGLSIIPSYGLDFSIKDHLLEITTADHRGNTRRLSLSFRTDQGGESQ